MSRQATARRGARAGTRRCSLDANQRRAARDPLPPTPTATSGCASAGTPAGTPRGRPRARSRARRAHRRYTSAARAATGTVAAPRSTVWVLWQTSTSSTHRPWRWGSRCSRRGHLLRTPAAPPPLLAADTAAQRLAGRSANGILARALHADCGAVTPTPRRSCARPPPTTSNTDGPSTVTLERFPNRAHTPPHRSSTACQRTCPRPACPSAPHRCI